jgi:hypothetical protein
MGAASAPWADGLEHINVRLFLSMCYRCESFLWRRRVQSAFQERDRQTTGDGSIRAWRLSSAPRRGLHGQPAGQSLPHLRLPAPPGAPALFPADEPGEGDRTWRPDRDWRGYRQPLPNRFTLDKPGTGKVMCQRLGCGYTCREYRCSEASCPRNPGGASPSAPCNKC